MFNIINDSERVSKALKYLKSIVINKDNWYIAQYKLNPYLEDKNLEIRKETCINN